MTCSEVQQRLPDYLRGKLSDQEMSLVALHLHECKDCPNELASLQQLYDRLDAIEVDEPHEQYWQTLLPRIHRRIETRRRRRVPEWVPRFGFPLAAAGAVIVVALEVLSPPDGSIESPEIVPHNGLRTLLQEMSAGELQQIAAGDAWTANGVSALQGDADVLRQLIDTASISLVDRDEGNLVMVEFTDDEIDVILAYLDQKQFTR